MQVLWILSAVVIAATVQAAPKADEDDFRKVGRIANGENYDHEKYPYVVALIMSTYNIFWFWDSMQIICSGTFIAPLFVLTAAHCTNGKRASHIDVYPGSLSNSRHVGVRKIFQHPAYNETTTVADISLLKLKIPFPKIERYAVIAGVPADFADGKEKQCQSIGFGETLDTHYSEDGLITNVTIKQGDEACRFSADNEINFNKTDRFLMNLLEREFLCMKPDVRMVCPGDSGGPLICDDTQYGVASHLFFAKPVNLDEVCGDDDAIGRFVFLHNHRDWISSSMDDSMNGGNSEILHHGSLVTAVIFTSIVLCVQH